ncbi:hypothetical protein [Actinotalea subterranea]|uniref:hypothetical protein n=1 Tax=Actinotalea subterranea TaxID=2607497 RepID=UPI0011EC9707|nr:hypothetical protein [Actinotalea subterranea]
MSRDEMRIVMNCINEALETSVDGRLPTVGADKAHVVDLWERLNLVDDDDGHVAVSLDPEELRVLSGCVATAIDIVAEWERPIRVARRTRRSVPSPKSSPIWSPLRRRSDSSAPDQRTGPAHRAARAGQGLGEQRGHAPGLTP